MAVTTVVKTIGAGGDYTTLQSHEDAAPSNYTSSNIALNAQAGSTSVTIVLSALDVATDGFYVGHAVYIAARPTDKMLITAYVGATKIATVGSLNGGSATWGTIPSAGENYAIDQTIWQGQIKSATDNISVSSGPALTVSGGTVSSSCYFELTTASGASFRDNANAQTNALRFNTANGCSVTCSSSYTNLMRVNQDFCRFSNLQLSATGSSTSGINQDAGYTLDYNNMIIEISGQNAVAIAITGGKIRNSLIVGDRASMTAVVSLVAGGSMYNCTVAVPSNFTAAANLLDGAYGTPVVENCALFGGTAVKTGGNTPTYTTCYTDVASPPSGFTTAAYTTAQFVRTDASGGPTYDYRLVSGSAMIDTGTTDSTNAAFDIVGTSRPQGSAYDVGCWEFKAAGNTITAPLGTITLTGLVPTLTQGHSLVAPLGTLTLTGLIPTFSQGQSLVAPLGTLTLQGLVPTFTQGNAITAPLGQLLLQQLLPSFVQSGAQSIVAPLGILTLQGLDATFVQSGVVPPPVQSGGTGGLGGGKREVEKLVEELPLFKTLGESPTAAEIEEALRPKRFVVSAAIHSTDDDEAVVLLILQGLV